MLLYAMHRLNGHDIFGTRKLVVNLRPFCLRDPLSAIVRAFVVIEALYVFVFQIDSPAREVTDNAAHHVVGLCDDVIDVDAQVSFH